MNVRDRIRSVVQRLPGRSAGTLRLILVLGIAGLVAAGGLLAGREGLRTRSAIDAARRENGALRDRQEALREQAFDLAQRLSEEVARGDQAAGSNGVPGRARAGRDPRLPAPDAGNDALLAWLSGESAALEASATERATGRVAAGGIQAYAPEPVSSGPMPARSSAAPAPTGLGTAPP